MRRSMSVLAILTIGIVAIGGAPLHAAPAAPPGKAVSRAAVQESYARLPLSFEVNRGQATSAVRFLARSRGSQLLLTPGGATLAVPGGRSATPSRPRPETMFLRFIGANAHPRIVGLNRLPGTVNYFIGNDPHRWHTNIPTYARVQYQQVYPGINLVFHGSAGPSTHPNMEYDWVLKAGADPRAIRMAFNSSHHWTLNRKNNLVLRLGNTLLIQGKPAAYQIVSGRRRLVPSGYALKAGHRVGFTLGHYDRNKPLIIDPTLVYSTYLGGSDDDSANGIVADSSGDAYITGWTQSVDFPLVHPEQGNISDACTATDGTPCRDAFVTKLNPAGTAVLYSTYIGGSYDDSGNDIAVDSAGDAYIVGSTASSDFPVANALQPTYGGGTVLYGDAFVVKLSPSGGALLYSTYLGGSDEEQGFGIAIDGSGSAYITGSTRSSNFPLRNAAQAAFDPGACVEGKGAAEKSVPCSNAFVAKLTPTGAALAYSTYLGGSDIDVGQSVAVDGSGSAYVTGWTQSSDSFPTTARVAQHGFGGGTLDAFVTKLNPSGNGWVYSTYLGGGANDDGDGIAVDSTGSAYVTGSTLSDDFPTTQGSIQTEFGGNEDAFVTKLNTTGSALIYSTYLGGTGADQGAAIALDSAGDAYIAGSTSSDDFPTASSLQPYHGTDEAPSDAMVAAVDRTGKSLLYSTYFGGTEVDNGSGVATDSSGNVYLSSQTDSNDFPTMSPVQGGHSGALDAAVVKIFNPVPAVPSPTSTATPKPATANRTAVPTTHKKRTIKCKRGYKLVHHKCKRVKKHH